MRWSEFQFKKVEGQMERTCLRCRKPFKSAGRANRICKKCTKRNANVKYDQYYQPVTETARQIASEEKQ